MSSIISGHFTQLVWKGSNEIGVGKAVSTDGKSIAVASYRPAGNFVGKYEQNVLPTKDGTFKLPVKKGEFRSSPCYRCLAPCLHFTASDHS